eukprot:gene5239-6520_t
MAPRRGASSTRLSKPSTASKPTTTKAPAKKPEPAPTPAAATPQQPQPVVVQGPGMLATMGSSMAGAVAGNVIGHALVGGVSSLFGGGNNQQESEVPQTTSASKDPFNTTMTVDDDAAKVCNPLYKSFMTCLEKNSNDLASCQWVYDSFLECKKSGGQPTYY